MPDKFNHTFNDLHSLGCVFAKLESDEHRERQAASMKRFGQPAELVRNVDLVILRKNYRRRWTNTEMTVVR